MKNCPSCKRKTDQQTSIEDPNFRPKPGDYTICLYCGVIMRFDENLVQRIMTREELILFKKRDLANYITMYRMQQLILKKNHENFSKN